MLSQDMRNAIKLSCLRQYEIAHTIGCHPGTLSAWVNGIYNPRDSDPRVDALADLVGVPRAQARAASRDWVKGHTVRS